MAQECRSGKASCGSAPLAWETYPQGVPRLALPLALLALALPAAAHASTTDLGAVAPAGSTGSACSPCSFIQRAGGSPVYTVPPGGGVITSWSIRGGTSVPAGDRVRLRIFGPGSSSGSYKVIADSIDRLPTANAVRTMSERIPVSGGETIGLRLATSGDTPSSYSGAPGDLISATTMFSDPGPGQETGTMIDTSDRRLNVAVKLESDLDRDGFGDDTQDSDDDGDGLADDEEPRIGTNPLKADTDGDGTNDRADNCRLTRNRDQADSDSDGTGDACERDDDADGLTDVAEELIGSSRTDRDTDDDGLSDSREDHEDTNPLRRDTDRDGLTDGLELGVRRGVFARGAAPGTNPARFRPDRDPRTKTDPRRRDTDRDGLRDGREDRNHNGRRERRETDPRRADTDGDAVPDGAERFPLDRPR